MKDADKFLEEVKAGKVAGITADPSNPALAYFPMDIETTRGAKVRYMGYGGYDGDKEHANKYLTVREIYTVTKLNVGDWSSTVELKEFPELRFNTVMFENYPSKKDIRMQNACSLTPVKFRKKPVVIEAMPFFTNLQDDKACMNAICIWINKGRGADAFHAWHNGTNIFIPTMEGQMTANCGDWIIQGVQGEFYPCKPDIFEATYEAT